MVGYFIGRGYWFWDLRTDTLFWNKKECKVFGHDKPAMIGTYDNLFNVRLMDDDDRAHVKKTVEIAKQTRMRFTHQFCATDATTGEKIIIDAYGWWLFDEHSGEPWAMMGWNKRLRVKDRDYEVAEARIKLQQLVEKYRTEGVSSELKRVLQMCHINHVRK